MGFGKKISISTGACRMRLFTGISLPSDIRDNLKRLLDRLRPLAPVKWSAVDNLHITTKFIGEWPAEHLDELIAVLRDVPPCGPIRIAIRGLGWFPNARSPRVFWAGVDAPVALVDFVAATDKAVARIGAPEEARPFSPHLTLARIKGPGRLSALRQAVANLTSDDFGEFVADRFYLYLSELRPSGPLYTRVAEFTLNRT